jgi:hypothetical protein
MTLTRSRAPQPRYRAGRATPPARPRAGHPPTDSLSRAASPVSIARSRAVLHAPSTLERAPAAQGRGAAHRAEAARRGSAPMPFPFQAARQRSLGKLELLFTARLGTAGTAASDADGGDWRRGARERWECTNAADSSRSVSVASSAVSWARELESETDSDADESAGALGARPRPRRRGRRARIRRPVGRAPRVRRADDGGDGKPGLSAGSTPSTLSSAWRRTPVFALSAPAPFAASTHPPPAPGFRDASPRPALGDAARRGSPRSG